ncbi:MAG: hypothetical protein Q8O21_00580 [bacterium]|nr:hypothetical protein [bacterium]
MKEKKNNQNPLTISDLAEFTEEVLLPAVENIVDQKLDKRLAKQTHDMKNYIDSKLTETKGDIISYIKGDKERDKSWKIKVINILKRQKLAKPEEIRILSDLIR